MTMNRRRVLATGLAAAGFATPARGATTPMRIGYVPVIGASALFLFARSGAATGAGLDLTLTKFDTGAGPIQAMASGTFDAVAIGVAPMAVARARGIDLRIVAAASTAGSGFVASAALAAAFAEAGGDPAKALPAFKARTGRPAALATLPPGGVPNVLLNYWLFKTHATPRDSVRVVAMGIEAMEGAILAGAVDGGTVLEPALSIVLARDPRLTLIIAGGTMFPGIPGVAIGVSGGFVGKNPDAVTALIRGLVASTAIVKTQPELAAPFVQGVLGNGLVATRLIAKALTSPNVSFVTDPRDIEAATKAMLAYEVELGDFKQAPLIEGLFDQAAYDRATRG
jgi:NitT/TauT family transport system substrate-binding protein